MLTRFRWPLLILSSLFVLGGAYAVERKTGGATTELRTKVITPLQPPRPTQRGWH
ncbi:MAG: hypothetical protein ABI240_00255 [Sphingomonas sp.]